VFLVPTFIFLNQDVLSKSSELQKLSKSQTAEEQLAQTESAALQTEAKNLAAHDTTPTASAVLQTILAVSHSGIALEGFTYTPPDATGKGSLEINGTADTREDLRNYDESLSALPYITNADLPISDYAAESNIVFTITLTGTFTQT
jgi:Tfp pilus assembly protein PilN